MIASAHAAPTAPVPDDGIMSQPEMNPEDYPPIDPREPVPDDPGELLPDAPEELPPAPVEPMPDDGDEGGVREPA
ncbi:hypothetical protein BC793_13165 [Actinoplanes xinjiangensis]|jgi:hypothetical protein|uniref:Uncharacterized protein n=2 Tax=Actinoplanes xinjiangensis TaxID=512350 RepID=A0A316EIU4_9ACTN|nr:hypothetical protein BC793_13165 [Actinoplanes xinjiangensis]